MIIYPVTMKVRNKKHEGMFALAGLCGVVLYYFLENVALTYTFASNAGVISSVVPFFSFLLSYFLLKDEPLHSRFFIGFFIAMTGIVLISMNGMTTFQLNPLGDALALTATIVWAFDSILSKMINQYGYHIIQVTRRVFFYGLLWMIPLIWHFKNRLDWERLTNPSFAFHLLFLGLFASAICFFDMELFCENARCGEIECVYLWSAHYYDGHFNDRSSREIDLHVCACNGTDLRRFAAFR
ncbi:hypothetical protein BSAF29S_05056 [Bacillus safensis subsp. safensis]